MSTRHFATRPDLQQLKHQAKDLLRAFRDNAPEAVAEFGEYHPEHISAESAKLADAQLVLARSYGISSWPRLAAMCEVIQAIQDDDVASIRRASALNDEMTEAFAAAPDTAWALAVTQAANDSLRRIVNRVRQQGKRDINATEVRPWVEALRILGRLGARFPKDGIAGAVESLASSNFAFMVEIGTDIADERGDWRPRVALALETYARNPAGKHAILETMAATGIPLPDTPTMAVHRGRVDLLEQWLQRDPTILQRTFSHQEIFPRELGCHADESLALVGAPLGGATLLHMAADYEELEVVRWLLDEGMDSNARADVAPDGFGGQTALFNCVVTYHAGGRDDRVARLLLDNGAEPNVRASMKMRLPFAKDSSTHEYRDVTPYGWGRRFHDQDYVSQTNMRLIAARGGIE